MKKKLLILCLITLLFTGCNFNNNKNLTEASNKINEAESYTANLKVSSADDSYSIIFSNDIKNKLLYFEGEYDGKGYYDASNKISYTYADGEWIKEEITENEDDFENLTKYPVFIDLGLFDNLSNNQIEYKNGTYNIVLKNEQYKYLDFLLKDLFKLEEIYEHITGLKIEINLKDKSFEKINIVMSLKIDDTSKNANIEIKFSDINNVKLELPTNILTNDDIDFETEANFVYNSINSYCATEAMLIALGSSTSNYCGTGEKTLTNDEIRSMLVSDATISAKLTDGVVSYLTVTLNDITYKLENKEMVLQK